MNMEIWQNLINSLFFSRVMCQRFSERNLNSRELVKTVSCEIQWLPNKILFILNFPKWCQGFIYSG